MTTTKAKAAASARKTPAQNAIAAILAGQWDDALSDIVKAVGDHIVNSSLIVRWRIDIDGLAVSEDELTLDEAYRLQNLSGTNWRNVDPMKSAVDCRALLIVLLQTRCGMTEPEAEFRCSELTVNRVLGCISQEVSAGPLDSPTLTNI